MEPGWVLLVGPASEERQQAEIRLRSWGCRLEIAEDGFAALAKAGPFGLAVVALEQEWQDGFEVVRHLRAAEATAASLIVLTGASRPNHYELAREAGADFCLGLPIQDRTHELMSLMRLAEGRLRDQQHLEQIVAQLEAGRGHLERALGAAARAERLLWDGARDAAERLARVAEYRDHQETPTHLERVSKICAWLAETVGMPPARCRILEVAARLHDVGKVAIPDAILLKPGPLDPDELVLMQSHTVVGARLLGGAPSELLRQGESVALTHHERWDGGGYPYGLAGDDIPLEGRVCAIADVFDALNSERPYRRSLDFGDALAVIREGRGTQFDPALVDGFCSLEVRLRELFGGPA